MESSHLNCVQANINPKIRVSVLGERVAISAVLCSVPRVTSPTDFCLLTLLHTLLLPHVVFLPQSQNYTSLPPMGGA